MNDEGVRIIHRSEVDAEVERLRAENAAMRSIVAAVARGDIRHCGQLTDVWVLLFDNPTLSFGMEIWQQARTLLADER